LSSFLGVNPAIVRLFFVLLCFGEGIGIYLYLLLWVIIPLDGQATTANLANVSQGRTAELTYPSLGTDVNLARLLSPIQTQFGLIIGSVLILLGITYLIPNLHLNWLSWLDFDLFWPILLILGGVMLLVRRTKGVDSDE
jgi:phage shock protein PspC (stress-responsive transcriptional regulator)